MRTVFLWRVACVLLACILSASALWEEDKRTTIFMIGDSTMANKSLKDGNLESMVEHTKIEYAPDGRIVSHFNGEDIYLTGKEPVSMNFFGFTPRAFDDFYTYWENFIRENVKEEKKECLLPNGASEIVTSGKGSIRVFTSEDRWFGMTYPEDKPLVMSEIRAKLDSGYYPEKLWEK